MRGVRVMCTLCSHDVPDGAESDEAMNINCLECSEVLGH
jgi:ribosomal protein S27E